jgi:hypothetical protein
MGLTRIRAEQISDIDYKQAVRVITTSDITLSGGAPATVDGVSLVTGDRVLVSANDPGSENGIYEVQTVGAGSTGTWVRASDGNATGELQAGLIIMVTEGNVYKDTQWKLTTNNPIIIGTTALVFEQNSAFAFGNIYANSTAVLATSVGDSVTFTAGDNINILGNNTSKTVTIGVTGISLNSISNGTSNVNVVSSGGNVTVGVGGTSNVAVFAATGEYITGLLSVTGNITGGNILGNGASLSGINTFSNVTVTGSGSILADSISDTLTFVAGDGISITANTVSDTITIASFSSESIFATGGDMGQIDEAPTVEQDLGPITEAVTESYDLGGFFLDGLVGNDNFLVNSINGNILTTNAVISTTGNITAGNLISTGITATTGNVTGGNLNTGAQVVATGNVTGGNLVTAGAVYSNFNTNTANTASFNANGGNTKGGTGYLDFLVAQNISGGATNPYKWFRTNSTGGLEIINSAYDSLLLSLTDAGALSVANSISVAGKKAVNGPAFRASIAVGQAITSGSQQKVTFGTETFDTDGNFASSRFTPTTEGYYQLNSTVRIDGGSSTGEYMLVIWKNGAEYSRGSNGSGTEIGASFYSLQVSDIAYANGTGDYFEIYIQQTSGSNKNTTAGAQISYFSGAMVRGA